MNKLFSVFRSISDHTGMFSNELNVQQSASNFQPSQVEGHFHSVSLGNDPSDYLPLDMISRQEAEQFPPHMLPLSNARTQSSEPEFIPQNRIGKEMSHAGHLRTDLPRRQGILREHGDLDQLPDYHQQEGSYIVQDMKVC